jgi:serine/threonine-protein kinase
LTRRDDGSALVKILDFGAAKVLSPSTHASGVIRGTPMYMASEQASGEPSSPATDIWALGLIAFFLLTRKSYWLTVERGGVQVQLFAEILSLPFEAASERARAVGSSVALSPGFDAWFSGCVNRDVSRRFASAPLAARELSRALGVSARAVYVSARTLETLNNAAVESVRTVPATRSSRARLILPVLSVVLAGGAVAATTFLKRWSGPEAEASAVPSEGVPSTSVPAAPAASASASASAPTDSASATRPPPSAAVPVPAVSSKADKIVKKKSLPNSPSSAPAGPKAPVRDVYDQR